MERSGDPEREIWGTSEDLLLACAVSRHGTRSWDTVAMELQNRSSAAGLLTPQNCRKRYRDLESRFSDGGERGGDSPVDVPWVEELRRLRVAELRREVERYDVSIVSLQLKVKRLNEERERSLGQTEAGGGEPDLKEEDGGSPGSTPDACAGERISGGDSGRSCKESNSTDPKEDEGKSGREGGHPEGTPGSSNGRADLAAGRDEKAAGEGSYNGSSETIGKGAAAASTAADTDAARLRVGESGESVVESKEGEADGEKDSSDVQSSASLSRGRRRVRRRKAVSGSSSVGEEREADVVSKRIPAESQPLVSFLEIIRSHKFGSVFERRLESQETVRYRCLIRQHVDLEMVRAKLERVGGAYTSVEFFRDLLLLCNNAMVFYPKSSPESIAAVRLRELVAKEMSRTVRKMARPSPAAKEPTPPPLLPPQPAYIAPKLKPDPDTKSSTPLIVCRNHSSISAKEATPTPDPAPAAEGAKEEGDEKHDPDRKEQGDEDQSLADKKTKQRSVTRGLRSNKSRARSGIRVGDSLVKSPNPIPAPNLSPVPAERTPELSVKAERKNGGGSPTGLSAAKKRGAATFLNRLNRRSPPSSNGTLLETLKGSSSGSGDRGADQKKAGRGDGRKDQALRRGAVGAAAAAAAAGKQVAEKVVPVKRSVGRPPKRAAPPPLPTPAKRAREEVAPPKATPPARRKRGRK